MTRSDGRSAATGRGEGFAAAGAVPGAIVVGGVALEETIVGEGEGAVGEGKVALGNGEGAVADCRQEAKRTAPKTETNPNLRR